MRKIIIYAPKNKLNLIKKIIKNNKEEINKRNIEIIYQESTIFFAELYGYDKQLKMTIKSPSEIPKMLEAIDKMPMGAVEKKMRESFSENLTYKCGLPSNNKTSHCFADATHHTCCMLGPEARKYADNSGNPIGITSENAFYYRYGRKVGEKELTPWCTCTGSKVCSYYADKFKDGTHIKFISNLDTKNEDEAIKKMGLKTHTTPGIRKK